MDQNEFIDAIKLVVEESSINDIIAILNKPPGRKPSGDLLELSQWYNKLNESDRRFVQRIISKSVFTSIFGFLCVLDGVRAFENGDKGELKLYYEKNGSSLLLNNFDSDFLHELYNAK